MFPNSSNFDPRTDPDVAAITTVLGESTKESISLPIKTHKGHIYSQQIYLQEEIGRSGMIAAIQFQHHNDGPCDAKITLALGHTTKDHFEHAQDWAFDMQQVFEGDAYKIHHTGTIFNSQRPTTHWVTIKLPNHFPYDNKRNLVVALVVHTTPVRPDCLALSTEDTQAKRLLRKAGRPSGPGSLHTCLPTLRVMWGPPSLDRLPRVLAEGRRSPPIQPLAQTHALFRTPLTYSLAHSRGSCFPVPSPSRHDAHPVVSRTSLLTPRVHGCPRAH